MRKLNVAVSVVTFFVAVFAICVEQAPLSANLPDAPQDVVSFPGNWSLACLPTVKPQPVVDAYSVTTNASKGLTITQVGVRNESEREVVAVRLGWRLFLKADPYTNLKEGGTPLLGIPLSAGERRVVEFPVVTASRVLGTMLKNGKLQGEFRIEVAVVDVLFADSSSGAISRNLKPANLIKTARWRDLDASVIEVSNYTDPRAMGEACQDQVCEWGGAKGCYICSTPGEGFGCQVTQCTSCTETRCP